MCREMDGAVEEQQIYRHIIAVSNRHLCERSFEEQIRRVCSHRPQALILREKDLDEEAYEQLFLKILPVCREYQVPLFLHGNWRLGEKWNWPDLHLPLAALRELRTEMKLRPEMNLRTERTFGQRISVSVHSVAEAAEAEQLGAARLIAGHIYETDCKKGLKPRGLDFLSEVCRTVTIPVYGIGGIRPDWDQIRELLETGAAGGCVMSGMMRL